MQTVIVNLLLYNMSSEDEMANGEVVSEAGVTVEQDETLNFDQWSVEMGLTRKTTALLRKEDLGSLEKSVSCCYF